MININNGLVVDKYSWLIFGLLWILFPKKLLLINFEYNNYNWITIHMTQAFGLFCIMSAFPSYNAIKYNDSEDRKRLVIKTKLIVELILLFLMITANKKILYSHFKFGIFGISLCIIINIMVLCVKK